MFNGVFGGEIRVVHGPAGPSAPRHQRLSADEIRRVMPVMSWLHMRAAAFRILLPGMWGRY